MKAEQREDLLGTSKSPNFFCDGSAESPAGRRSLCYDREALPAMNGSLQ